LQKDISELESELDQKRVDHMIKIRKLNPNDGRGFMMGGYTTWVMVTLRPRTPAGDNINPML
jgi:hypothetical protein